MKIKMFFFFDLSEGMENCKKKSGKSQGISRWMASDNPGNTND